MKFVIIIHCTRINENIHIPFANTNKRLFTIRYFGSRIWNSPPSQITNIQETSSNLRRTGLIYVLNKHLVIIAITNPTTYCINELLDLTEIYLNLA